MDFNTQEYKNLVIKTFKDNPGFERVSGNMDELGKKFIVFCEKIDFKPVAAFGTAIGALRHRGPIPWDDDMDIMCTYDELQQILKHKHELKKLGLKICTPGSKKVGYSIGKIRPIKYNGSFIDIFLMLQTSKENIKNVQKMAKLFMISSTTIKGPIKPRGFKHIFANLTQPLAMLLPTNLIGKRAYKKSLKNGGTYMIPFSGIETKEKFARPKSDGNSRTKVPFGDSYIYVLENEDKYLTSVYGKYMELPDAKSRKPHHKLEG